MRARRPPATNIAPVRTCVGCRSRRPKTDLIRITVAPDGAVIAEGRGGRAPGRGAYVCSNPSCASRALKSGALRRALKCEDVNSSELTRELGGLIDIVNQGDQGRTQDGEAQGS
ncbi:MAG: YlxR family protein [Actinomycetota bacterium]